MLFYQQNLPSRLTHMTPFRIGLHIRVDIRIQIFSPWCMYPSPLWPDFRKCRENYPGRYCISRVILSDKTAPLHEQELLWWYSWDPLPKSCCDGIPETGYPTAAAVVVSLRPATQQLLWWYPWDRLPNSCFCGGIPETGYTTVIDVVLS
jgi:hypothetical protein